MTEVHDAASRRCHPLGNSAVRREICEGCRRTRGGGVTSSANEAVVRRAIDAIWNHGDLDVADELFAPDYVNHDGVISDLVFGPEAVKISAALHRLAFPHLRVVVGELRANEDIVVLGWIATSGPDIESNQSLQGITRSRLRDGKIVESWTEWDEIGVLRKITPVPTE
jgi:hypothetical protein